MTAKKTDEENDQLLDQILELDQELRRKITETFYGDRNYDARIAFATLMYQTVQLAVIIWGVEKAVDKITEGVALSLKLMHEEEP
jgi:hypothetical protein